MKLLKFLSLLVMTSSQAMAGLSDSFSQQQAATPEPVAGAEEQYELVRKMKLVIAEALEGRSAKSNITVKTHSFDKFDPYSYFFTDKYLVRFGSQYGSPSEIFGQKIKCGVLGYGREGFGAAYPFIIGIKDGANYVQTEVLRDQELEVSPSNPDHCFIRRSVSFGRDVEKCSISYQSVEKWAINSILREFNKGLSACAEDYKYPKFESLKF
jgi:hypothetical protein